MTRRRPRTPPRRRPRSSPARRNQNRSQNRSQNRKRGRSRTRSRSHLRGETLIAYAVAAVVAVVLVGALVQWLLAHWWLLVVLGAAGVAIGAWWVRERQRRLQWEQVRLHGLRYQLTQLDALHHRQFEHAVRDLMHRDGCADAVQVGGAGDNGADVKATDPLGRRWVIQCKHRRDGLAGSAVGTPDLQILNGTARPVHGADVVVLVTNGRFSSKALPFAHSQRINLVDRGLLAAWAAGSQPLWELIRHVPPPRGPGAGRPAQT
ncbi:restriction endonuclease [Streptomyces boluensis]|uniref:Restriction endonuclease n=1 Tax=Streptomyces boluensis TaxID=1775135 RepID=A0A964UT60_9ACTN|nr:restriction endonuclease [Streptomyces boluensis]NBE53668.1 restriction endonuclease [Streptomyces boluensis]